MDLQKIQEEITKEIKGMTLAQKGLIVDHLLNTHLKVDIIHQIIKNNFIIEIRKMNK